MINHLKQTKTIIRFVKFDMIGIFMLLSGYIHHTTGVEIIAEIRNASVNNFPQSND